MTKPIARPRDSSRIPADVESVDLDRTAVHVVEPRDEVRRRGLARARRSDQRDELARLGLEVELLQRERGRGRHTIPARDGAGTAIRAAIGIVLIEALELRADHEVVGCWTGVGSVQHQLDVLDLGGPAGSRSSIIGRRSGRWFVARRRRYGVSMGAAGLGRCLGVGPARRDGRGGVAERDPVEADPALDPARIEGDRIRCVGDLEGPCPGTRRSDRRAPGRPGSRPGR